LKNTVITQKFVNTSEQKYFYIHVFSAMSDGRYFPYAK